MRSRISEVFHTTPLLWSPADLQLVNAFFVKHRAALALFRTDHVVKKRQITRRANAAKAPGKQQSRLAPAAPKKNVVANKRKKAKAKLLDDIDLDQLLAASKGADK